MSPDPDFGKLEFRLLRCRKALGLEHQHVAFLCLLRAFDYNAKGYSFRGQETYAELLGVSIKTIERWTALLKTRELIEVKRRRGPNGKHRSNEISWRGLERRLDAIEPPDTAVSAGSVDHPTQLCPLDHPTQLCPEPPDTAMSAEVEEVEADEEQQVEEDTHSACARDLARQVLGEFNRTAQSSYAAPKWAAMIAARCREHPDLGLAEHAAVIARNFATPWWGDSPSPLVFYRDAGAFEQAMRATGRPRLSAKAQRVEDRTRERLAFARAEKRAGVIEGTAVEIPNGTGHPAQNGNGNGNGEPESWKPTAHERRCMDLGRRS